MVSAKQLLSVIESALLGPYPPSPAQRVELMCTIRKSRPLFQSLLSFPPPKPADRSQVQSREVRLPDSPPISLDDQDVQIALKLSDDLHLNEIDCVRLLVSSNQQWGLMGREQLEILRLAAGLWYTERRNLTLSLYTLFRAVVLDQGLEADIVADIQKYLEDLIEAGLRQRLISIIKELNREEPAGLGGPLAECYILDSRGAFVERRAVVSRERLILGHCLSFSVLVVRASPSDVKDMFYILKDCIAELNDCSDTLKQQFTHSLLFSLVIAFISDALGAVSDKASILSSDSSFRHEFQETVIAVGNNPIVEGFVDCIRLAWVVHLMLIQDGHDGRGASSNALGNDLQNIHACLELIHSNNVFQFYLDKILRTAAYQNDDEDMIYMYNAYLHKLVTCFLSHPVARDKVKEMKEKAMIVLSPYHTSGSHEFMHDNNSSSQQPIRKDSQPFVSLLEFVSEIYEREPELLSGNDVLWTFINFAGGDHTNFQTLVAFLKLLATLASNQEGASKVFELLQGNAFRSIRWRTLFDCLSIYEEKFKHAVQTAGAMLPEFQEGDAKALVAYLNVLQKVMENGNTIDRKNWFPDIEPLFKLLSYENVPPYLKGALRNAIATFVKVSTVSKDTVWSYLDQYDLPVVVGPNEMGGAQLRPTQVYDMQFELNEIEARIERYPSTISFLGLLNDLIMRETDVSDKGRRYIGIFRFIYDHVFGPFAQRAYADPCEKWQLAVTCLQHFQMILSTYELKDEDIENICDKSQLSSTAQEVPLGMQLPVGELLKDFMSGKTVFRNIMGILLPGANFLIAERSNKVYGQHLEKAVLLSLQIILLVLDKDLLVSDYWCPLYQPFDVVLAQDHNQVVALLEYVRYDFQPKIQQCSIKIMSILSSRMVGLVQLLLKSNAASCLIEDYAACLEARSEESQFLDISCNDLGVLIMQLLIDNVSKPAPNITHLLLKFDIDAPVERTFLQPKFHYSCLKVILDILENLSNPAANSVLHEFCFQLLHDLCVDPLTCGPTMDLLTSKKYQFFVKHLDTVGVAPLPKRNSNQVLRISSLHQRAWLLKLLAVELHVGDICSPLHREACQSILAHMFGWNLIEGADHKILGTSVENAATRITSKSKVLELLEVVQFKSPDTTLKFSQIISDTKIRFLVEDIIGNPNSAMKDGVYYYSERGDRLIDLASFRDKLCQLGCFENETELNDMRETTQQLLRWGWKYNKNLEEKAAQLHMLAGWSQIVEIAASRRLSSLENRSEILFQLLDACLTASASPDCSLKMALILSQVSLTCMAKLRDEKFLFIGGLNSGSSTLLDAIMEKQLSNGACHSVLVKLVMAILRHESSEALRKRQYALLLSYIQYCQHMLDMDVPTTVLRSLLLDVQENEDQYLMKMDKEQIELALTNFSLIKKEAQPILDLVLKDATRGSESGKTLSVYVLDAFVCIDHEKFFLDQLQNRGFLRSCLSSISNFSYQDGGRSLDSLQRACTLEAELALLLRISHKYGKSGAHVLFTMGALEHLTSFKVANFQGTLHQFGTAPLRLRRDAAANKDKQPMILAPTLRLVLSLTSLVDTSDFLEVKNKIVCEVIDFVKGHQLLFDRILQEDVSKVDEVLMEQINLAVGILSKVWPYEESDEYGFIQRLFAMMQTVYGYDYEFLSFAISEKPAHARRRLELGTFRLCFSLSSYLYYLVTRKSVRLQVSDGLDGYPLSARQQLPTLTLVGSFLNTLTSTLERAAKEKSVMLNKIHDINELSRQEVDEIIDMCARKDCVSSSDNMQKRRYIAKKEMCEIAGNRDQLITLLLLLAEHLLNVILIHFQESRTTPDTGETAMKMIANCDSSQDTCGFCGNLIPTLERLELLSEDKVGHNLKVFHRLVSSLKEITIQKLTL